MPCLHKTGMHACCVLTWPADWPVPEADDDDDDDDGGDECTAKAAPAGMHGCVCCFIHMSHSWAGSRMTQNLSSFLRYKYTGSGPATANEEQDLRGFESNASIRQRAGGGGGGGDKAMNTITEYDDEPLGSPQGSIPAPQQRLSGGPGRQPAVYGGGYVCGDESFACSVACVFVCGWVGGGGCICGGFVRRCTCMPEPVCGSPPQVSKSLG